MTLIFGFACMFCGYLALPIAAGFYATLLSVEKKESRVISYIVPLLPLVVNIFLNGFSSLEALAYVIVGVILFVGFDKKMSKAATVFFATLALVFLMILSFVLFAFDKVGTFKNFAVNGYFLDLYESGKIMFVENLTSFTSVDADGSTFYNFNAGEAVDLYNTLIIALIPIIAIASFLLVGISSKILSSCIRKTKADDERLEKWRFITSPFLAYSYLALAILSSFSSEGVVGVSLLFVASILFAVYFYIGVSFLYELISFKKSKSFALLVIILTVVVFSRFAPQIISYIGIFVNNRMYKIKTSSNADVS